MRVFLETIVLLITLHGVARADISSGRTNRLQSVDESSDEIQDEEILRAVVTSMEQWNKKHSRTRIKRSQPNSVCYEELGCFEDSGPFGYLEMLPSPPQEINTRFLLYSTRSRGDIPLLDVPFSNISMTWQWADRAFNSSSPTKVIVHGFGSNCDHVWVYEMRSALMAVEECNVICVDWEAGAVIPNYVRAAANTRLVGKQLAMLLEGLAKHINLKFDNVHFIGFSLGAHVAGFAGSQLKNISRITGLDPAGPLFEAQDPRARLDSTDAKFVDVIHSNGENLILGGLGSWQPMGHVDFYPNGGRMQTGCSNLFVGAVTDIIWSSAVEGRSLCNHRRAYKFFTDSVSPKCHFPSFPCDSYDNFLAGNCFGCNGERRCGNMGYYADRSTGRGQLYLLTRDEEPFCAHQYHVKVESSRSNQSVVSYGRIMLALVGDSGLNETFPMTRKDDSELILGSTISRMLVPHPALGIPVKVQLQYQAYSGWISSGLNRWTIDKVVLSDSFGKTSSICKKGLILNSGTPVILPLYPGDCNHPSEVLEDNSKNKTIDKIDIENKVVTNENPFLNRPPFIPTQVIKIGDEVINNSKLNIDSVASSSNKREDIIIPIEKTLMHKLIHLKTDHKLKNYAKIDTNKDDNKPKPNVIPMGKHFRIETENQTMDPLTSLLGATDILNLPWQPLLANSLDNTQNERENGRAFGSINTKFPSFPFLERKNDANESETILEIVEPILKAPSTKNARSHDTDKLKKEITEPILGSTTIKIDIDRSDNSRGHLRNNRTPKTFDDSTIGGTDKIERNIESSNESHWIPSYNLLPPETKATTIWDHINRANKTSVELQTSTSKSDTFSLFQWQNKNTKKETPEEQNNNSISSFTVQFLPSRLVSFLEKAEKYARNTLLPLVSAYTPRFLLFGAEPETPPPKEMEHKYVPLDETPTSTNIPVPRQSQQEKIEIVRNIRPPNKTELTKPTDEKQSARPFNQELTTDNHIATNNIEEYNSQNDPIKIVKAPDMTTTTLPPITLQSAENSSEKLIIVYPSNIRDDRKIQSHIYPEIMQFESLYQQSINQNPIAEESRININIDKSQRYDYEIRNEHGIHVNLPTYEPPTSTPYPYKKTYTTTPKFIPVSYPSRMKSAQ